MRRIALVPIATSLVFFGAGCEEKEATDPGMVVRAEVARSGGGTPTGVREEQFPIMRAPGHDKTLRCGCDINGGLHIAAPPGAKVTVPEDAAYPAEAEITLPQSGGPIRRVKSLGYIGDTPLWGGLMNR
jgi:hypothetical protein